MFWYIISDLHPAQWALLLAPCLQIRKLRPPVVKWLAPGQVAEKWQSQDSHLVFGWPTHVCLHLSEGFGEGKMRAWACEVGLVVKNPPANTGDIRDTGSILGSGRSPGGGHGNPLQYSCLENPMDRGLWWATIQGVTESWCFCLEFSRSYCLVSKRNFILC